jgi:integrase
MSKPIRRGGRYYLRRRVPLDLVSHYGKREITKALGTAERAVALVLCVAADDALNLEFATVRAKLLTQGNRPSAPRVDPAFDRDQLEGDEAELAPWTEDEIRDAEQNALADRIITRLAQTRLLLGLESRPAMPLQESRQYQEKAESPAGPHAPCTADTSGRASAESCKSLAVLVDLWAKERQPEPRTADAFNRAVTRFRRLVGDIPVPSITKAHVVTYKDKLQEDGCSPITTRASLSQLQTLLRFAMGRAWVESNVGDGVTVTDKARGPAKASRPPMSVSTLNRLFASKVYTEGFRPVQGAGEAVYWLPLLGLYQGARIEELAQIAPTDVYQEAYREASGKEATAWVLRITDQGEGQGVKNTGSVRRVPIHPELIRLGFIEYCQQQHGQLRIFPLLRKDKDGREAPIWSKWWHRDYFRRYCKPDPKEVFHSLRHLFKDVCRENDIDTKIADYLQGHTDSTASGSYGSQYYPLRPLVAAMRKFEIHGVHLPS